MADDYICNVCHQKIKTKLKRAHEASAKHKAKLQKLNAPKRPAPSASIEDEDVPVAAKRGRPEPESIELHSAAVRRSDKEVEATPVSALPDNFFDSTAKEKAAAASADMEKEFSKFISEVGRIEQKEEEIEDKEDAIRNDLEMIDDQIEMWRHLNELEKQKEQLVANVHSRVTSNEVKEAPVDDDDMDDSDGEFDAFGLDWRSRKI